MDRSLIWPAVLVAVVLVVGFVVLEGFGHDTATYVVFVSGPLVSTLVGVVLAKRVTAVKAVTDVVAHQTNSMLSSRLTGIEGALADAHTERNTLAESGPLGTPPAQPSPDLVP